MAYKRPLTLTCQYGSCTALAKWEVFNCRNAPCGKFCTRHANAKKQQLEDAHARTVGQVQT